MYKLLLKGHSSPIKTFSLKWFGRFHSFMNGKHMLEGQKPITYFNEWEDDHLQIGQWKIGKWKK